MKLSVELLDHIFSFLVSHRTTLIACSRDPVLSQIVERHLYQSVTVVFKNFNRWLRNSSDPDGISRLVSENPRILNYVRVLKIQVQLEHCHGDQDIKKHLDQFAKTLLLFPALECIKLTTSKKRRCDWPDVFRAALEDRLNLPTLKEVHIVGNQAHPCSLIDHRKNIEHLLLKGPFEGHSHCCVSSLPQLKSLTLLTIPPSVGHHVNELRSLKCASSAVELLPELIRMCSQTLIKLDIDLWISRYFSKYTFQTGELDNGYPLPELSPVPPNLNLRQLTIRASAYVENEDDENYSPKSCESSLPAAANIINTFVYSTQHLVLEIDLFLGGIDSNLAEVDFSPLAVLGAASLSIPRIDLYVHTDILPSTVTLAQLLSSLGDYDDIMRSMEEGNLVIHAEETASDYVEEDSV